jgi:hypothetical protein
VKHSIPTSVSLFGLGLLAIGLLAPTAHAQSKDDLIKNALSAAPEAVAMNATVVDGAGNVLRKGSNGYTCLPDDPERPGNSPMCLDAGWLAWADAWMNKKPLAAPDRISFGYMLQGDFPTSNTDPYATAATADNEWQENGGPHVMVIVPDLKMLDGISTDSQNGGPYVMWRGTEYAHLMIPVSKK